MTINLPGRRLPQRKHRAPDRIRQLEAQVTDLSTRLSAADQMIRTVLREKSDTYLDLRNAQQQLDCTNALAATRLLQIRALKATVATLEGLGGKTPETSAPAARRLVVATSGSTNPADIPQQRKAA